MIGFVSSVRMMIIWMRVRRGSLADPYESGEFCIGKCLENGESYECTVVSRFSR